MAASAQYHAAQMKNSFNFVAEEQENEDMGSDGRENITGKRASGVEPNESHVDMSNNGAPPKSKRTTHAKKQSAIKSYGDIANQLLTTSPKNAIANDAQQQDAVKTMTGDSSAQLPSGGQASHRGLPLSNATASPLNLQNMAGNANQYANNTDGLQ